jgi:hypothetical protein
MFVLKHSIHSNNQYAYTYVNEVTKGHENRAHVTIWPLLPKNPAKLWIRVFWCLWCMEVLKKMLLIMLIYMSVPLMPDSITWYQMKNVIEYREFKHYNSLHTLHTCTSVELYLIMFLMLIKVSWYFINPSILGYCKIAGSSWIGFGGYNC